MTVDNPESSELELLKAAEPSDQPLAVLKLSAEIASHTLIEAWDSKEAIQTYNQYLANPEYENVLKASKAYFTDKLQDRAVNTKIGLVRISSKSKGKIHDRMRDVKYLAIPFIPEILLAGDVGDFVPLHKDRTDSAEGFYEFVKLVDLEAFKVLVRLKVSQDSHGNLLYFLAAQKNKNPNDHITSSGLHGANPGSVENGFDAISHEDSTSQTGEEINIEFVEVQDATGKVVPMDQLLEVLGIKGFDHVNNPSVDPFANQAATSSDTDLPQPTPGQLIAGHYTKGEFHLAGLAIEIENPAGSVRKGVAVDGVAWESQMTAHYGYLANTIGVDGDELDVFVKAGTSPDWNGTVYVVKQVDPLTGKFDEHKLVFGADSQVDAESIYLSNYEDGWQGLGSIKPISIQLLKERINNGGTEIMFDSTNVEALYALTDEEIKSSPETAVSLLNTCCLIWEGLSNNNGNSQGFIKGRNVTVKTAKGTKISTVLAVVEATSLITSHDGMGAKNPAFPQELQPRDRGREASQAWVQKVAANLDPDSLGRTTRADTGAPIIGPDMVVESGNGRTMAINLAYARGQAEEYRKWLIEEADYLGFKAELVAKFTQPVLVRLRESDIDRVAFTVEANQDDKLSLSATERAKSDAKRIDDNLIQLFMPGEDGDLLAGSNQKFIQGFLKSLGDTESAQYVTTDGKPTQSLVARIKAAVFQKAYGDERLLEMVADQTRPEIQNVLNALNVAAPKFIESQAFDRAKTEDLSSSIVDSIELSMDQQVVDAIIEATNVVLAAKSDNQDVAEYVKQQGLFGDLPEGVAEIAVFISQNGRSSKKLALFFKAMATYIEQYMVEQQNHGLFGDSEPLKINAVIGHAIQKIKNEYGDNVNLSMFDSWLADGHYEQISIGDLKQHPLVNRLKEKQPAKNAPILVQQTHSGNLLLIVGVKVLEQLEIQGDEFAPAIILDARQGFTDKVLQKVMSKYAGSLDARVFAADAEQLVEQLSVNSLHGFDAVSTVEIEELKQEQDPVAVLRACLAIISQMDIGIEKLPVEKLLAKHDQFVRLAQEGKITVEEWKQNYYTFLDNIEVLQDYLNSQKVKELLDLGGAYFSSRYRGEKKDRIVKALVQNYLQEYALSSVVSYTWGQTFEDAIKEIIENGTQQNIDDFAKEYSDLLQAHQDKIAGMEDPQTLDDFQRLLSFQREKGLTFNQFYLGLTPEQRARMDILSAELSLGNQEAERKAQSVNYNGEVAGATIHATQHTRDGHDIWTVELDKRLEREDYQAAVGNAKKLNGYYSSYRGGGAIPGFVFRSEGEAKAFVALVAGDSQGAQALVDQQQSVYEDNKAQSTIERLRSMADSLEQRSSAELDTNRKVNTARRIRMARAIEDRSRANIADAETMRNLANAIENKSVKFLGNLRARTQLDFMNSMLRRAKWKEKQANPDKCTELEGSGVKYPPLTTDTASYVEFPNFGLYRSEWAIIGRQLVENKGTKQIGANLLKIADDMTKEYLTWLKANYLQVTTAKGDGSAAIYEASKAEIEYAIQRAGKKGKVVPYQVKRGMYAIILAPELAKERGLWVGDDDKLIQVKADFGNEIIDAIKKAGINMPWQLKVSQDQQNALNRLRITSPAMLRAALREFISLKVAPQEPDEIKELERDMIGREKDGLDFFPTPDSTAMDMIQMAQLGPDMKVLEPSAGMGHIAEKIRAFGVEPDVIEYSGPRRELLEKKGFTVIGDDFMRVTQDTLVDDEPIGLYDRIIMNPPFSNRQDAEHVQHAYDLLKPGGRIVAIMGEGVFYGQDAKAKAFRNWLDSVNGESEKLPDKTFMDASLPVNTGASARIVVINK